MRHGVAALTTVLLLLAGIAVGGAGHGWVVGSVGCFALAPLGFVAALNGLRRAPSFRVAVAVLAIGLVLLVCVAVGTLAPGGDSASRFLRATGAAGWSIAVGAYVGWLSLAVLAVARAKRVQQHGT